MDHPENIIVQIKTLNVNAPDGPTVAMMIAVDIGDPKTAESFVASVAERFKVERMLAPPETSMLLVTLVGELSANTFAARFRDIQAEDPALAALLAMMRVADVMQAGPSGQPIGKASLLLAD
jgi:hypothetical protein